MLPLRASAAVGHVAGVTPTPLAAAPGGAGHAEKNGFLQLRTRDAPAVEAGTVGDISRIMFISIEREILQWTEREPFRLNIRIEIPIPASFGDAVSSFLDTTKDVAGLAGPLRPGGVHGHHIIVIVIGVEKHRRAELPELVQIGGHPGTGPRFVQGRQQHCRKNCDDGDNYN